jgi:hypothetical protein
MRKTQSYRETKMRLLQKLTGIDWVEASFNYKEEGEREWFKGIYRYPKVDDVFKRYLRGEPISCFRMKEDSSCHVAMYSGDTKTIRYLTFEATPSVMSTKLCGVHFSKFIVLKDNVNKALVRTIEKDQLAQKVDGYALMLPYKRDGVQFDKQFTLIYHDWDVFLCKDGISKKGFPVPDNDVFSEEYMQYIDLLF